MIKPATGPCSPCRWVASILQFSLASSLMSWKLPPVSSPLHSGRRRYSSLHGLSDDEVCRRCEPRLLPSSA